MAFSIEPYQDEDQDLAVRAAWLYYVASHNQEETAAILGVSRIKVNRLLALARESGIVTISVDHRLAAMAEVEETIRRHHGLRFCLATPPLGIAESPGGPGLAEAADQLARRAVGVAAARWLRGRLLAEDDLTVGVGWGRTLAAMAEQLPSLRRPGTRFVSLMGSLPRNAAANPFEVVQQLAARTGGEGHFLPVPFVADSEADRRVLMSQRFVQETLALARRAAFYVVSLGECDAGSSIYRNGLITEGDLDALRRAGAVGDTIGKFFDADGRLVEADLNERTLAVDLQDLQRHELVLLAAGPGKLAAARAMLASGLVDGLIVDGDTALALVRR
ncbi:sugar-binding transcriptional regulator [Arenibaculum pallidiluteum]|uniref:sugar-binding transcriptional regulator n=1 Tax=Arenibaculum pallidiluteum TaxID=2812559 RepID=UPI001A95EC6C|nr:sugar-binding transcriptional regulator [Arenibaculum pallidiluteum]